MEVWISSKRKEGEERGRGGSVLLEEISFGFRKDHEGATIITYKNIFFSSQLRSPWMGKRLIYEEGLQQRL